MAISLSQTFLSINRQFDFHVLSSENSCSVSFSGQKSHLGRTKSIEFAPTPRRVPRVLSRTSESSLSSIINELEIGRKKNEGEDDHGVHGEEEERRIADVWREIHGHDNWAGMLDPVDPLLRSEMIRYGEMAQACYDAFDFDPFSKYCGSCRFTPDEFFDALGMAHHGYMVSGYLFATSNINLPNFFKKSRWPKVWSRNANWIGYVAVSNDEMSKHLGRRDISIAWRGTVTRLEWIADLMDFLKPVSSNKLPCSDPAVKAESGFLDLYNDKDLNCRYCKF